MKARKVPGLDPDAPLEASLRQIVSVRLEELRGFAPAAREPGATKALHDMRIAAKRLRYVLEMGEPVLGPAAKRAAKEARRLQDLLGEIHDCDEGVPRVLAHLERRRADDAAAVTAAAGARAKDLDPGAVRGAPHRRAYAGLDAYCAYLLARRDVLYAEFLRHWGRLERRGYGDDLLDPPGKLG